MINYYTFHLQLSLYIFPQNKGNFKFFQAFNLIFP